MTPSAAFGCRLPFDTIRVTSDGSKACNFLIEVCTERTAGGPRSGIRGRLPARLPPVRLVAQLDGLRGAPVHPRRYDLTMPIPLLTLLVALTAEIFGCDRKPPIPENLILITVDTLRADRIGAYGKEGAGTPNLDALASSGTTFTRAYAPMGRTTPALASMMTGLWPHHHGSREVGHKVERGTFLATHLKGAGFATIGITANRLAGKKQGFSTDFDVFEEHPNDASVTTDRAVEAVGNVSHGKRGSSCGPTTTTLTGRTRHRSLGGAPAQKRAPSSRG